MGNPNQTRVPQAMPEPTTRVRVSTHDELDVWVMGEGAPVVLVHGAMTRDLLTPLADQLTSRGYQVIHYGRRGYGGVGLPGDPADFAGQATDVVTILDSLGIGRAHVAGHSLGAFIALELATRAPDRLLSASLLEPVFGQQLQSAAAQQEMQQIIETGMPPIAEKYTSGDEDGAVTMFWDLTSGVPGVIDLLEPVLPKGARELAAADLNTVLQVELPALGAYTAEPAAVKKITTPVAWIGGTDTATVFAESGALVREWLPTTRTAEIAGAAHYFPVLKPAETAATLDELVRSPAPAR